MLDFLGVHWSEVLLILLVAADAIVSLTPSKSDDKIVGYLKLLVTAIASDSGEAKKK